ncbi:LysR family transcriptional regulator [Pseudoalteromonas sp. SWXJZ94C]|uniref:LysR family transcriptional regulator n=1 Tax=Pseudoalteromonas sp. SWXJZ94C TaxID=2792065 RepID=UPI0018CD7151|nr:LysR family transcriptional regulator [Pseudoalteromonas sp. SWXJZ94C]MBH0056342.1 LysR family transcriptional regulator [Pseudoalteromonas sp. SWXJZ94C]
MDIKTLKSFVNVAKHQSFSEAAKELHTVQPAISRHIAQLENELDVVLFIRNSRDVAITQAGEQLLKDANAILALAAKAKTQVKRAHNGQVGTLNIAHLSSACLTFMATLVRKYKQQYPHVHVTLFEMTATEQINAFKNELIDIGFSRPLPESISDEFIKHDIYIDKLVAVLNKDHNESDKLSIDLNDLKNDKFVIFDRDEAVGLFDETIMLCKSAGFSPNIISHPRHMQTLVTEVAAGLGISIAPHCVRKLYSEGCVFVAIKNATKKIPVEVQYKQSNLNATVHAFVDIALAAKPEIQRSMA